MKPPAGARHLPPAGPPKGISIVIVPILGGSAPSVRLCCGPTRPALEGKVCCVATGPSSCAQQRIKCIRIPAQSPNCNPHAERFVRTNRNECLDHLFLVGERHLRLLVKELVDHYLTERFHQGLGGQLVGRSARANDNADGGAVSCRSRLGGLLNFYHREAARRPR